MLDKRQEQLLSMESAVLELMENPQNEVACKTIEDILSTLFNNSFTISVVPSDDWFVMSVYPERNTMELIIRTLVNNGDSNAVEQLWKKNSIWSIEIDEKILGNESPCTEKEVVAMILHEVGHIILSNKVTSRIMNILRYEVAKASVINKRTMADKIFAGVMSLPFFSACVASSKDNNLKEEIKADKFVRKMGYQVHLISALQKLSKLKVFTSVNNDMKKAAAFSANLINQFNLRQDTLVKKSLFSTMNSHFSPAVRAAVESTYDALYSDAMLEAHYDKYRNPLGTDLDMLHDKFDKLGEEALVTERPDFLKKSLKRIDPSSVDYVEVMSKNIKNNDDRLLVVSYARHTLDLVDYYLAILHSAKDSNKYLLTNSEAELNSFKLRLEKVIQYALAYKIPTYNPNLLVQWPAGYEG